MNLNDSCIFILLPLWFTRYRGINVGWKKIQHHIGHFLVLVEYVSIALSHKRNKADRHKSRAHTKEETHIQTLNWPTHLQICILAHLHTRTLELHFTHWHSCTLAFLHIGILGDLQCTLAYLHICILAHLHTCTFAHLHTCTHALLHTGTFAHWHICTLAHLHT